jgi:hypothetical protein
MLGKMTDKRRVDRTGMGADATVMVASKGRGTDVL